MRRRLDREQVGPLVFMVSGVVFGLIAVFIVVDAIKDSGAGWAIIFLLGSSIGLFFYGRKKWRDSRKEIVRKR